MAAIELLPWNLPTLLEIEMSEYPIESKPSAPRDGGPAFPTNGPDNGVYGAGISVRDYFAAKAMQGMLSRPTRYKPRPQDKHLHWHAAMSKEAYEISDAMLAAREGS